jgi:hypothetical protein
VLKYGREDNTKKNLILFMAHSIMLQIIQTSKGFLRNGLWHNLKYCHYFTIITFYKTVNEVLSPHPPGKTEKSKKPLSRQVVCCQDLNWMPSECKIE